MTVKFKFSLKEPQKEESLLLLLLKWENQKFKLSTKQRVNVSAWDKKKQLCVTSKEAYSPRVNRQSKQINTYLEKLSVAINDFYDNNYGTIMSAEQVKRSVLKIIDEILHDDEEKKKRLKMSPIRFFEEYVEKKRIDPHTGRYIGERTKVHQRTVINRLKSFLEDNHLPDDFSVFASNKFDKQFTEWCYSVKEYKQNTVYATYGVLKPLLNAAQEEGFDVGESYKHLKGKCVDVDAIYLNEQEIGKIYNLDIKKLIEDGEVDVKSTMEITRDLFIISCWTGLRRSDINRLDKATFNVENKTIAITAEKTKRQVVIPMHPMVLALWKKYNGRFPHLGDKGKTNNHLRECARHAGVDEQVRIVENRAGKVKTLIYKKYQLVGMHTGRRSFATNMYKRKFPTIAIMRLTGHTTESNFLKYIKVTPEENAAMMAEEFFKAQKPFEDD
jgi:integrase